MLSQGLNAYAEPQQPGFRSSIKGDLVRVTPPAGQICSLAEAKNQCRQDVSDDDSMISDLVDSATAYCEQEISGHRQFLAAIYDLPIAQWWGGWVGGVDFATAELRGGISRGAAERPLEINRPPLFGGALGVVQITYYDTAGVLQTLPTANYLVRPAFRQPGEIDLAPDQVWPSIDWRRQYPITVRFQAGYAAPITSVDGTGHTLTTSGRIFSAGDGPLRISNAGGGVGTGYPTGLNGTTDYFVVNPTGGGNTIQLATTVNGAPIAVSGAGTGNNYVGAIPSTVKRAVLMLVHYWYDVDIRDRIDDSAVYGAVKALLDSESWGSY